MNMKQISIKGLTLAVLAVLAVGSVALSVFGTYQFHDAALESQKGAISRMVKIAAGQSLEVMRDRMIEMAESQEKELRKPVKSLAMNPADSDAKAEVIVRLNDLFHQRYATTGLLSVKKFRLYTPDLQLLAQSTEGSPGIGAKLPELLRSKTAGREGAERLKTVGTSWSSPEGAMYSVLIPIGGLRVAAYLEVVTSPAFNLQDVAETVHLPLTILAPDGKQLFQSESWNKLNTDHSLPISYLYKDASDKSALELVVLEDMSGFNARVNNVQLVVIGGVILLMLLGVIASLWLFNGQLFKPLGVLIKQMDSCADGDLTIHINDQGLKEISVLGSALSQLVERLRLQVASISDNSDMVASSAEKLSVITEQASTAAAQHEIENNQVSLAIKEMASSIGEVAESAVNAADAAKEADVAALDGRQVVTESIAEIKSLADEIEHAASVIKRVENDTESVGTVLAVIGGIAEQTNLLALNAAIEAARAGEHGRGFAVVADEVRTLASRTQESTQEIRKIIESLQEGARDAVSVMDNGQERVKASVAQALKAEESLNTIKSSVATISSLNDQIASTAEVQSAMSSEISNNVHNISCLVSETASGTKETARSSVDLTKLAKNSKQLVSHFKIN